MTAPSDPFGQVEAAVLALFDGPVAVGVTDPCAPQSALLAGEDSAVAGAVPARQREFAAGRAAARVGLVGLGAAPEPIPVGPDRAPIWPHGVTGSISHNDRFCIAVLGHLHNWRGLGVDIEAETPLDADLIPTICSDTEQSRIAGPDQVTLAKLIFSAKEATYKAQYPLTGMLFGYDHLDVTLDAATGTFSATFLKSASAFKVGDSLPGRFARVADHLVTGVAIGQGKGKGA